MKPIHRVVINVPLLLLLVQVLAISSTATSLRISKSSAPDMAFKIDAQGNASTKLVKQIKTAPQVAKSLALRKGTVNKLVLDNVNYYVAGDAYSGNVARTKGELVVGSSSGSAAKITVAGDLVIKGKFPGFSKTSAVAYVGGATFTTTESSNGTMVFACENIDGEGKTTYSQSGTPDQNYFFMKDHLGSTRFVLSDAGAISDYVDYRPYGATIDLTPNVIESEVAREKFTGKESDQEGAVYIPTSLIQFDVAIRGVSKFSGAHELVITLTNGSTKTFSLERNTDNLVYLAKKSTSLNGLIWGDCSFGVKSVRVVLDCTLSGTNSVHHIDFIKNYDSGLFVLDGSFLSINLNETAQKLVDGNPDYGFWDFTSVIPDDFMYPVPENRVRGLQLDYFGARYYDPEIAQFTRNDPKAQDWNVYAYCGSNPINAIDPDGAKWWHWALLGVADMLTGGAISMTTAMVASTAAVTATATAAPIIGTGLGAAGVGVGIAAGAMTTAGGIVAGAMPVGQAVNDVSYTYRMATEQGGSASSIFSDYITGGAMVGGIGNSLGLLNMTVGGTVDWYEGYTVYSGGAVQGISDAADKSGNGFSGSEYFGPALFVTDRTDKRIIMHEIHHMRQMNAYGNRFGFWYDYAVRHNTWFTSGDYDKNPYEIEAYFYDYAYANQDFYGVSIGIYGNGNVNNQRLIQDFINGYNDLYPGVNLPSTWQPRFYK